MNKRIGIIGSGNVGASLACILTAAGENPLVFHDVNHPGVLKGDVQSITIYGKIEGTFHINQTTSFSEFSSEVDTVFVCTPSYAHEHIYRAYIPRLNVNTVVINITGNFASIIYGESLVSKDITVADIS